jgi:prophage regulatory protein
MSTKDNPIRLILEREVLSRAPYTRAYLYQLEERGEFPRRLKLGPKKVAWVESEVDDWIKQRMAERDAAPEAA